MASPEQPDPPAPKPPPRRAAPPAVAPPASPPSQTGAIPALERRRRSVGWRTGDVLRAAAAVIGFYLLIRLIWVAQSVFLTAFLGVLFGLALAGCGAILALWP